MQPEQARDFIMRKDHYLWWKKGDVVTERAQLSEEGRDISGLEEEFAALSDAAADDNTLEFQERFRHLLDAGQRLPQHADNPWREPDGLEDIRRQRPEASPLAGNLRLEAQERIRGAWLGRCAGCLLGKPVEGWRTPKMKALLAKAGLALPERYLWDTGLREDEYAALDAARLYEFGQGLSGMPVDDDINYTVAALVLVERKGFDFTPADVADFWIGNIPAGGTCTAERVAYRNFLNCLNPPESAVKHNPFREWIGAQIRADLFGYICPGDPQKAAELAWRDASISHVKNGIYGEMWVAAMLAAAAVEQDMRAIITAGLGQIPARCRLAAEIRRVLDWHAAGTDYHEAVARIHAKWDENTSHHWCHTISNAMIVALSLLYGDGDFTRTIACAVYPCFDTDCNGATAGSIFGLANGGATIGEYWCAPLKNTVYTSIADNTVIALDDLCRRTASLVRG